MNVNDLMNMNDMYYVGNIYDVDGLLRNAKGKNECNRVY